MEGSTPSLGTAATFWQLSASRIWEVLHGTVTLSEAQGIH